MPRRTLILRTLAVAWALISIGIGVLAFFVVSGTAGADAGAGAYEAFETIPEAAMQMLGFDGAPIIVTIAYWAALIAAVVLAFRTTK